MPYNASQIAPSKNLEGVVRMFFMLEYQGEEPWVDHLLPTGTPSFFYFETEEEFDIHFTKSGNKSPMKNGFYLAYTDGIVSYTHKKMRAVGLSINPIYLHLIFGEQPSGVVNRFLRLEAIHPKLTHAFKSFSKSHDTTILVEKIEAFISQRLTEIPIRPDVELIYKQLKGKGGFHISIEKLAKKMGYSTRHTSNLFKTYFGLSPKKFLRIIRFNEAIDRFDKGFTSLTQTSFDLGYHDQAHFVRDFKAVCGRTPSQMLKERTFLAKELKQLP